MPYTINIQSLNRVSQISLYAGIQSGYLNVEAVFSDETLNFISNNEPASGEYVTIKIRAAKDNVDSVLLNIEPNRIVNSVKTETTGIFDYWSAAVKIEENINYYFTIIKNNCLYFYNKRGLYKEIEPAYNFKLLPDFKTPVWAKGAVMYQIYVDRFYNGDKSNDVVDNEYAYIGRAAKHIDNWENEVSKDDICNFYGGDLKGVIEKMSYLQELGIDAIYFNPIFVSPSNHKYDIQDYDYIDPHYGVIIDDGGSPLVFEKFHNKFATMYIKRTTDKANLEASNQLMASLIQIAHDNGIKVILDGVFNHCGAFNKWLDKEGFYNQKGYPAGAYREQSSPYNHYFKWYEKDWPNNDCYDSWWGHDNHPKLYFEDSKELYDYILNIGAKWVSPPFNADGWRLDVAADLGYSKEFNHKFWKDFRVAVKKANPNAIILAEHYGDPDDWLKGDQWDTVMNYDAFMEPITWFLTGMEKHSETYRGDMFCNAMAFENAMRYHMSRFSVQSLQTAMNQLSNHDHSRFLTRTNMTSGRLHTMCSNAADIGINKGIMFEAVVMQMTWPGAPTIYYGDEAGLTGWTDPDNRRTYPWGKEDACLLEFHKEMIRLHKTYECLKTGSLEYLYNECGIISYGRWDDGDKIVIIINNNNIPKELDIPVWKINTALNSNMKKLIATNASGFNTDREVYKVTNGLVCVSLPSFSSLILKEAQEHSLVE